MKIDIDKEQLYARVLQVVAVIVMGALTGVGAWGGHVMGGFFGAILGMIGLPGIVVFAVMARMWKNGGN